MKTKLVYVFTKSGWRLVGAATVERDGSINVTLEAPPSGELHIHIRDVRLAKVTVETDGVEVA
jgi:hypothetical protein